MKNQPISSGSVLVTFRMAADVAAKIQSQGLDFRPLFELLDGESFTPNDAAEALLAIYFAFTQAIILHPDATDMDNWNANVYLGTLEKLYRAFKRMEKSVVTSPEPAAESGE